MQRRAEQSQRRHERARDIIDALQRELLPSGLPVLPRLQIAASYLLAAADASAGGDWFDALVLPDRRTALVVGDVVGHGVAASATMGQLRVLLHEELATGADIRTALAGLDAAAGRIRGAHAATVCVVMLDPATGALEYCTAGHPAPLVLSTTGDHRYLSPTGAGPIGVGGRFAGTPVGQDHLAEGEIVLLYSDGILERPGRELGPSSAELARAAADAATDRAPGGDSAYPVEWVCSRTPELLTRVTGHTDDITLLAGQRVPAPPELRLRVPTELSSLPGVRARVDAWLAAARIHQYDADALRHAVVELVTNVVDHAFIDSPDPHTCDVAVTLADSGHLWARVSDGGRWREPKPSEDRGLGLHLTKNLVDSLRVEHDEGGTTVTVEHRASTPARLLSAGAFAPRPLPAQDVPLVLRAAPASPGIRADGPVDADTVAQLERAARIAGVTGTRSLTLDLTGVTRLASAGVSALHRLLALHRGNGTTLRLHAPAGTPADAVLSLVQVPHDTT